MVLHVAGLADRLVLFHDVRLSSKNAIAVKTAEVLQVPVLALSLSVLVTEDKLRKNATKRGLKSAADLRRVSHKTRCKFVQISVILRHLITAATARLLAVSVVASTVHLAFLPEVDHVHQKFLAGTADEAGWVPHLVVAGPLGVDGRLAPTHQLLAVVA